MLSPSANGLLQKLRPWRRWRHRDPPGCAESSAERCPFLLAHRKKDAGCLGNFSELCQKWRKRRKQNLVARPTNNINARKLHINAVECLGNGRECLKAWASSNTSLASAKNGSPGPSFKNHPARWCGLNANPFTRKESKTYIKKKHICIHEHAAIWPWSTIL